MKPIENRPPAGLPAGANAEGRYHAARTRLLAAQQEKMEAAVELLAARAALCDDPHMRERATPFGLEVGILVQ